MSIRNIQTSSLPPKILRGVTYLNGEWIRNPSWLALAAISSSDQKFTGLYQINRYANFAAVTFNTSGGAQYTVNWGDGSASVNVNSGVTAYKEYDFTTVALAGTDAPVTFQDTGDTVTRTSHGYSNGMNITFATIVSTTGITAAQTYFVVNATTNTFQLANEIGGAPIALTTDGSGTILPYKQAVVTVTPVSGNLTVGNLYVKHNQSGLADGYTTGWLDVAFAGSYTTLTIGNSGTVVRQNVLQQANILSSALTSYNDLFRGCGVLQNIVNVASSGATITANSMFQECRSLRKLNLFDTSKVTSMTTMFSGCVSLQTIPALNTINVTTTTQMFNTCLTLETIPLLNTSNVANMNQMFNSCNSLKTVPLFNTSNVTDAFGMFLSCLTLVSIPAFNTINVTTTAQMFSSCVSLKNVPQLNVSNATSINNMFQSCSVLEFIPPLNSSNITLLVLTFSGANTLPILPNINFDKVTSIGGAFNGMSSLTEVPAWDLRKFAGTMTISSQPSLSRIRFTGAVRDVTISSNKLSAAALNEVYTNLGRVGNVGTANNSVTFQGTADTVTKVGHGFANLDGVRFSTITTTTGITTALNYYTINVTANTFQLANTLAGSAIDLVSDGTGLIGNSTITVSSNYGTTGDTPAIATAKGWTVTGS